MSTIGGSASFDHIILNDPTNGPQHGGSGSILPQGGSGSTVARHLGHFRGGSKFSTDIKSLQSTDPSFVKTLQSNIASALSSAKASGETGSSLAQAAQTALVNTFQNASASDKSKINAAFGTSIYDSNGNFSASALQSVLNPTGKQTSSSVGLLAPSTATSSTTLSAFLNTAKPTAVTSSIDTDGDHDGSGIGSVNLSA